MKVKKSDKCNKIIKLYLFKNFFQYSFNINILMLNSKCTGFEVLLSKIKPDIFFISEHFLQTDFMNIK